MSITQVAVLDLDGTLLDTAARHYAIYCLITQSAQIQPLPLEVYWRYRREGSTNLEVLIQNGLKSSNRRFAQSTWLKHIETIEMLKLDRLFPGAKKWLKKQRGRVEFVLVTLRSNAQTLETQLEWLGISSYFRKVLVIPHQTDATRAKAVAVMKNVEGGILAWVGDSEVDINAARQIGVKPIGVSAGIRTKKALAKAGAAETYRMVTEIRNWQR